MPSGSAFRCGSPQLRFGVELHLEAVSRLVTGSSIEQFAKCFVVGATASGAAARGPVTRDDSGDFAAGFKIAGCSAVSTES